jgi:hypothetical protein
MKQIKHKIEDVWTVYINCGRYDNNMYVIAPNEEEAIKIAWKYVEYGKEESDEDDISPSAEQLKEDPERIEWFKESMKDSPDYYKLLTGEIDGFCYDAGT